MKKHSTKHLVIAGVILLGIPMALNAWFVYGTADTITATVTKTERIVTGSGDSISSKYLVFTDNETFKNTDVLWHLKFNSADVQGHLEDGREYRMEVYGWRIPVLSMYRNIVSAELAEYQ